MKRLLEWLRSPAAAPLALAARLIVGVVLAASGFLKLIAPVEELALAVEGYRLLPAGWVMPAARFLPWTELLAGLYLFFGYATRLMAGAAAGLFAVFLTALLSSAARGLNLDDCGCFGRGGPHLTPWQAALMDTALLAFSLVARICPHRRFTLDGFLSKPPFSKSKGPSR